MVVAWVKPNAVLPRYNLGSGHENTPNTQTNTPRYARAHTRARARARTRARAHTHTHTHTLTNACRAVI